MAARASASSTISFGLISIPVKIFPSTSDSSRASFHLLHKGCGSRLKQRMLCEEHNRIVEKDEIVRGYEVSKDRHVEFTDEELKSIEAEGGEIAIEEFVDVGTQRLDMLPVERRYWLGAEKGGARGYGLLCRALTKVHAIAIAKYAARGYERVVVIRPFGKGLVLEQLYFHEQCHPFSEVVIDEVELTHDEVKLAVELVKKKLGPLKLEKYRDESKTKLEAMVDKKLQGKVVKLEPKAARENIIDLASALKASIEAQAAKTEPKPKRRSSSKPKSA